MDPNREMINDIYKIVKDNNKMLHAMRRRALLGGVIKVVVLTFLILTPIWFYMTYLNESVQNVLRTVQQMQDTGASVQQQANQWGEMLKAFQESLPFGGAKAPQEQ